MPSPLLTQCLLVENDGLQGCSAHVIHGRDHVEDIELSILTCQEQAEKELLTLLIGSLVLSFIWNENMTIITFTKPKVQTLGAAPVLCLVFEFLELRKHWGDGRTCGGVCSEPRACHVTNRMG